MSTFLQLCQAAVRECRISPDPTTALSTTSGQVGQLGRIVNHVIQAWTEIQAAHSNWRWMRSTFTLSTTADDGSYAYTDCTDSISAATISRFRRWILDDYEDPPKIYLSDTGVGGETFLTWITWEQFKVLYQFGTQTSQFPAHISVDPNNNIRLGPAPNDTYVVTGDYQKSAQVLSDDADTPDLPTEFENVIVYRAMEKHALSGPKPELLARADREGGRLYRALENDQLPEIRLGGPLA